MTLTPEKPEVGRQTLAALQRAITEEAGSDGTSLGRPPSPRQGLSSTCMAARYLQAINVECGQSGCAVPHRTATVEF